MSEELLEQSRLSGAVRDGLLKAVRGAKNDGDQSVRAAAIVEKAYGNS